MDILAALAYPELKDVLRQTMANGGLALPDSQEDRGKLAALGMSFQNADPADVGLFVATVLGAIKTLSDERSGPAT